MKALLVGYGEIGRGVKDVFGNYHEIDVYDPKTQPTVPEGSYGILLVAVPFFDNFVEIIKEYQKKYSVKSTIIFSTTKIGSCSKLNAVHCPVEGRHPDLAESIKITDKWLGGKDKLAETFLKDAGFKIIQLDKPEYTEFLKLRSTTVYGVNIEFARYSKFVCDDLGLDYEFVKMWDKDINKIHAHFGMDWARRYILDPPTGKKGGHCVVPNAIILNEQYPNEMVKLVSEE